MWFRLCVSVVLFHFISTNLAKHDAEDANETNKEEAEAIFVSVIKNISRVNHVLQELIDNYEHLQKIYKSQENLESESSDGEIDDPYNNKKNQVGRVTDSSTTPQADGYPATQMIWSDKEYDEDSNNDSSNSEKAANVAENEEELSFEPLEPNQAEIIFVDTHKATTKKRKKMPTLEPIIEIPTSKDPKTRYSKVSHSEPISEKRKRKNENTYLRIEDPFEDDVEITIATPKSTLEPKRNVEKKMQSEIFSPMNIWDDIMSNKPINLQAHSELTLEKLRKDNSDNSTKQALRQRSRDSQEALVTITNQNQSEEIKRPSLDTSHTDEEGDRDEFKATVLREAYGDACMKVVLRKCFKALKAAGKDVCQRFKCKSNYKKKFNGFAKTGCIREFRGNTSEDTRDSLRDDDKAGDVSRARDRAKLGVKTKTGTKVEPGDFNDMTRIGHLRSCLPHLQAGSTRSGEIPEAPTPQTGDPLPKFNILRDSYERACQKISYEKCKKACHYSYTKICESFTCNSGRKKAYKKQCNSKCKSAYKNGRSRGSSSDSSNSDSSDSNSS